MDIDEILEIFDEMINRAWSLPLTNGRCIVDAERVRDLIDDIRLNLPGEIKQARSIVADRAEIIAAAKKEAEAIIRKAEDRARSLVTQEEVVRQAQARASEILTQAQYKSRDMRHAAQEYSDNALIHSEDALMKALSEIRATRQALKSSAGRTS